MSFANRLRSLDENQLEELLQDTYAVKLNVDLFSGILLKEFLHWAAVNCGAEASVILHTCLQAASTCMGKTRIQYRATPTSDILLDLNMSQFTFIAAQPSEGKSRVYETYFNKPIRSAVEPQCKTTLLWNKISIEGLEDKLHKLAKNPNGEPLVNLTSEEFAVPLATIAKNTRSSGFSGIAELNSLWSEQESRTFFKVAPGVNVPKCVILLFGFMQPRPLLEFFPSLLQSAGFLQRLLLTCPKVLLSKTVEQLTAKERLKENYGKEEFGNVLALLYKTHHPPSKVSNTYTFANEAYALLTEKLDEYIDKRNKNKEKAIANMGYTKGLELISKIAAALHALNWILEYLNSGNQVLMDYTITISNVEDALLVFEHSEETKIAFYGIYNKINFHARIETKRAVPAEVNDEDIKKAVANFPGPVVTVRKFVDFCPRAIRQVPMDRLLRVLRATEFLHRKVTQKGADAFIKYNETELTGAILQNIGMDMAEFLRKSNLPSPRGTPVVANLHEVGNDPE